MACADRTQLDQLALTFLGESPAGLGLRFVESGFAGVSPGEDVEEAVELPVVCGAQAVEEAASRSFRANPGQSVSLALSLLVMGGKATGEN